MLAVALVRGAVLPTRAAEAGADDPRLPGGPLNERVLRLPGDPGHPVSLQVTRRTPAEGFTGEAALVTDEVMLEGQHHILRLALSVR
jgi:hypothetical protein